MTPEEKRQLIEEIVRWQISRHVSKGDFNRAAEVRDAMDFVLSEARETGRLRKDVEWLTWTDKVPTEEGLVQFQRPNSSRWVTGLVYTDNDDSTLMLNPEDDGCLYPLSACVGYRWCRIPEPFEPNVSTKTENIDTSGKCVDGSDK